MRSGFEKVESWKELIDGLGEARLLTTATSGVGDNDELILVRIVDPEEGWEHTFYRQVPAESVLKTQEYTGIQVDDISRNGVTDEAFKEAVQAACRDKLLLTYNVPFQQKFLSPFLEHKMYSLPLWYRARRTGIGMSPEDRSDADKLNSWAMWIMGKDQSFKTVVNLLGIDPWDGTGLYVDWAVAAMRAMWQKLVEQERPA